MEIKYFLGLKSIFFLTRFFIVATLFLNHKFGVCHIKTCLNNLGNLTCKFLWNYLLYYFLGVNIYSLISFSTVLQEEIVNNYMPWIYSSRLFPLFFILIPFWLSWYNTLSTISYPCEFRKIFNHKLYGSK